MRPLRIAYVTAGAAGMYCGSCLHDNTLARTLRSRGHDVALIPIYTPIRTDEVDVSLDRVFYGAINVYLEQKSAIFRHTPWLVDRLFNNRRALEWVSKLASSTDARDLGELTLSMLEGEHGKQAKELERLVDWLDTSFRPDVVHLSNSMLVGMSRRMKERLGCPVVCSAQGEDLFLEELEEPYRGRVQRALRARARDADLIAASSAYYAAHMARFLDLPSERVRAVPLGIDLEDFERRPETASGERPFTVGYLARVCPEKGFHVAVEAFARLVERAGDAPVRLRVAGYLSAKDRAFRDGVMHEVEARGISDRVDYVGEVDRVGKRDFLQSLDVLSVPTVYREPKGLFVLEALACGVPVVQPRHGAFPEMIEATGGGILVAPDSPDALAEALDALRCDPARRAALGDAGYRAVRERFDTEAMVAANEAVYRGLVERPAGRR